MNGTDDCSANPAVTTKMREASTNTGSGRVRRCPSQPKPWNASRAITRPAPTGRRTYRRRRSTSGRMSGTRDRRHLNARTRVDLLASREALGWLKAAEKSFDFWDNPADAVYDTL
jgi:hypothetical protein